METSSIILLAVSASISFALGRTIMHFRSKNKNAAKMQAERKTSQALRDAPAGPAPKNKSKRKRQARLQRHQTDSTST